MTTEYGLNEDELLEAQALIRNAAPGKYTLRKLYGPLWTTKVPTTFGDLFIESVRSGRLSGISFVRKKSNNSSEYEVHRR